MPSPSQLLLALAALIVCTPLTGMQAGETTSETPPPIDPLAASVRMLSARTGPPGSFRDIDDLRVLPLSHHSLWNRLRDGFEFAELEHPRIDLQIEFLQAGMRSLHANLNAARPYLRYIVEQVEQANMPIDIAMLPLVESAFNPHAKSNQNALGLWQFIPGTGELYGLTETEWYSGRKDVIASTRAALKYLSRLHKTFDGDWLLALAAYNTGQGNVRAAIRRAKQRGHKPVFWNLKLAQETRAYVPRLIAVSKMISRPEAYGVILPPLSDRKVTRSVTFDNTIALQDAADIGGVSLRRLVELNPGFKQQTTPPDGPNRLLVPIEAAESLISWNAKQRPKTQQAESGADLARAKVTRDFTAFRQVDYRKYTVRKGDNLWNIARELDTDLQSLAYWNHIGSDSDPLQPGDQLWHAQLSSDTQQLRNTKLIRYRVVSNDNVMQLSKKFGTRLAELKRWNQSLRHSHSLKTGQLLYIPVE